MMSKKQKRSVSHGNRPKSVNTPTAAVRTPPAVEPSKGSTLAGPSKGTTPRFSGSASKPKTGRFSAVQEFNPDYSYIKKDLKRIGILAGSFLSILVVLSFFLN
jgi:hypothetical protein